MFASYSNFSSSYHFMTFVIVTNLENVSVFLKKGSTAFFFKIAVSHYTHFTQNQCHILIHKHNFFLSLCCYCKWIPVEKLAVPRGHASLLPMCAVLSPTMPLASCMMYVDPPLCRARLNLLVYSSSQVVTPRQSIACPCNIKTAL